MPIKEEGEEDGDDEGGEYWFITATTKSQREAIKAPIQNIMYCRRAEALGEAVEGEEGQEDTRRRGGHLDSDDVEGSIFSASACV